MIDTIENLFDKNYEIIENLEIVNIIFMKFLNCCYNNEFSKKGGGLIIILILIKRFSKKIIQKYLRQIIRIIFLVSNNYSSVVKIKYENECQQIVKKLIDLFTNFEEKSENEENTNSINNNNNDINNNDNSETNKLLTIDDKKKMFFEMLFFFQEEIFRNFNSISDYTRKICEYSFGLIKDLPILKNNIELFLLIDKYNSDKEKFFKLFDKQILENFLTGKKNINNNKSNLLKNNNVINPNTLKYKIEFSKDDLYFRKILHFMNKLTIKLELNSSNFNSMISNSFAFNYLVKSKPELFVYMLISSQEYFEIFLKVIKNLFNILLCDMYLYIEITKKIHDQQYNSKLKYLILEKYYSTQQIQFQLNLQNDEKIEIKELENDLTEETLEEMVKYIFDNQHTFIFEQHSQNNSNYSPIDPYVAQIFPILSNKMKMIKLLIKTLKTLLSNKILLEKLKDIVKIEKKQNEEKEKEKENANILDLSENLINKEALNFNLNNENDINSFIIGNKNKINNNNIADKTKKFESKLSDQIDRFYEIKNRCTNLILRFIIFREEKTILKSSKKFIRKLLKIESNTKNLLPEEELKKCIKPLLEQVNSSRLNSFKIVESLAILIKLLRSNFNDTLARRLYEHISRADLTNFQNQNQNNNNIPQNELSNYDNSFNHAIISLLSHMKPNQIKDLFDNIVTIILKLEADVIIKGRNFSIFNSKFKNKIIKLFSNFTDNLWELLKREKFIDINNYHFFKKLIGEDLSYVIRDNLLQNYKKFNFFKNFDESNFNLEYLQKIRIFKILVKKSPAFLKESPEIIFKITNYLEKFSEILTKNFPMGEQIRILDEILKNFSSILLLYSSKFSKLNYQIFCLLIYKNRTKINRIKEKIKFFCLKNINENLKQKRSDKIIYIFIREFNNFKKIGCLDSIIKNIINPLIIKFYSKNKIINYLENNFAEITKLIIMEEKLNEMENMNNTNNINYNGIDANGNPCVSLNSNTGYTLNGSNNDNYNYNSNNIYDPSSTHIIIDDSTKMEVLKLFILLVINFYLPKKNLLSQNDLNDIHNFMKYKINSYNYGSSIYNYFLQSILYQFRENSSNQINKNININENLECINSLFSRHNHTDQFSLMNLCADIFISSCLSTKAEDIIPFMKKILAEKNININQSFLIFSIILRYPDYFKNLKTGISTSIINFNIKMLSAQTTNSPTFQKKISIQLLGLVIKWLFIDNKELPSENRMKENCLLLLTKYYKTSLLHQNSDGDYIDLARRHLLYIKELIKNNDFSIKKFLIDADNESSNQSLKIFLNSYLFLLKIAILYCRKDSILQNIEYFFYLIKQIYLDPCTNVKATNDASLIIRSVLSEKLLNQLNTHKQTYDSEMRLSADYNIIKNIKESFEQSWKIFERKKSKLLLDVDSENILSSDIKNSDIIQKLFSQFRNKYPNEFTYEKLFEIFPHFEFRYYFILYFYLLEEKITVDKLPNNKTMIEDVLKLNENIKKTYFDNFYIYTLIMIYLLKNDDKSKEALFETSRSDYYSSNFYFLYNFISVENLEKLKADKQPKHLNFEKKFPIFDILTETVLIGFHMAFSNKGLIDNYKSQILKLSLLVIETYQQILEDKKNSGNNLNSISSTITPQQCYIILLIEYQINLVLNCEFLTQNDLNLFILQFMKIYDYSNKKNISGNSIKLSQA
jgi:hypothetical protein